MDPLTHSATGIFLGRAGLNRALPQAPWILLLAANVPDIDILSACWGTLAYLNFHRNLTHAIALAPVMALLPVVVVRLFAGKGYRWGPAYAIALAGVASHLLLDLTNIYGIRLMLPFSGTWYRLDLTSVIDVWIWAVLLLAFAGPLIARLVGSEIGAASRRWPGRGFAIFALAFLLLYNGGRAVLHTRAIAVLEARIYNGSAPSRVAALPSPANPLAWRGLVETPEAYSVHAINLAGEFDPARGRVFYKPENAAAVAAARKAVAVRDFLVFSQYPLWRVLPVSQPENGTRVEVMDLRFGDPAETGFMAGAILDSRMQVVRSWFTFGRARPR